MAPALVATAAQQVLPPPVVQALQAQKEEMAHLLPVLVPVAQEVLQTAVKKIQIRKRATAAEVHLREAEENRSPQKRVLEDQVAQQRLRTAARKKTATRMPLLRVEAGAQRSHPANGEEQVHVAHVMKGRAVRKQTPRKRRKVGKTAVIPAKKVDERRSLANAIKDVAYNEMMTTINEEKNDRLWTNSALWESRERTNLRTMYQIT